MKKFLILLAFAGLGAISACSNASENGAETGVAEGDDANSTTDPVVPVDSNPNAKAETTPVAPQSPTSPGNPAGGMNTPAGPEHSTGAQQKSSQ